LGCATRRLIKRIYLGTLSAAESKILQVRLDTTNILNHRGIANPTLDIIGSNGFGRITARNGSRREFKGSVRLNS
jgi:hypothetical protein